MRLAYKPNEIRIRTGVLRRVRGKFFVDLGTPSLVRPLLERPAG